MHTSNTSLLVIASIFMFGLPTFALADTVMLKNGDRISGDIIELDNNSLSIRTTYAGDLKLGVEHIASFETASPHQWSVNLEPQTTLIQQSEHAGNVVIDGNEIRINELALEKSKHRWKKSGLLETSLDVDTDKDRQRKFNLNAEINLESQHWRNRLKAEKKEEKNRSQLTEKAEEFNYTLDYLFNNHWLMRNDVTYRKEGTDVTSQYRYWGAGPGYRLWGEGQNKLDAIISYNRLDLRSEPLHWQLGAWALTLNYKQFWLDEKLEVFSDLKMAFPTISAIDYIANSSSGLRYYFQHNINASFKYDYNETRLSFLTIKDSGYVLGVGFNF